MHPLRDFPIILSHRHITIVYNVLHNDVSYNEDMRASTFMLLLIRTARA